MGLLENYMRKIVLNLVVLLVTAGVALLLCEGAARLVLNPADYLGVGLVHDPILGAVPAPTAKAGFDAWGFRNRAVPSSADIVAVGDSHTFGNTARMEDAWPYVLGQLTGHSIYNLGMGGYGPNQYFYLTNTRALTLKPKMIIWGLYMGDDFDNAYSITYALDHWAYLRQLPAQKADADIWGTAAAPPPWHKRIRIWLSEHSVVYQLLFHASFGGRIQGEMQIRKAADLYPGVATSISVPDKNILEAFRPQGMLKGLDQNSPTVREGMRITFELIRQMNSICEQNHIQFVVVVIPIKEAVFDDYLEQDPKLPLHDLIGRLLPNEKMAREETFKFLNESHIPYVDALPALKAAREHQLYARTATDMHPGRNGYKVIGEATAEAVRRLMVTEPAH